jgi:hypothetical protein
MLLDHHKWNNENENMKRGLLCGFWYGILSADFYVVYWSTKHKQRICHCQ